MPDASRIPRIIPTPGHRAAMLGIWQLDGKMVRLLAEPETGVLVAISTDGGRLNPMTVISHGTKWDGTPPN